ncbi:MAG TPA: protein kinase [Thermoanaerobaculia bacterium]|nr:protein kinase [Thermoanaerobaculia bacterium]
MAWSARFGLALALATSALAESRQWYEHYERGLALAADGDYAAALAEFETAADHNPEARARARTYGTQFLFGYDPAYHRARCLLELKRFAEARTLLAEAELAGVTPRPDLAALAVRLDRLEREVASPAGEEPAPASPEPLQPAASGAMAPSLAVPPGAESTTAPSAGPASVPPGPGPVTTPAGGSEPRRAEEERAAPVSSPAATDTSTSGPTSPATAGTSPGTPAGPAAAETAGGPAGDAGAEEPSPAGEPPEAGEGSGIGWWPALMACLAAAALLLSWWRRRQRARRAPAAEGSQWHLKLLGSRLGGYQLIAEIGRGGMATTFRARRASDGRLVALKVPHPTGDPTYRERFLREGKLGEALHHPAIVRILEAGEDRGVPFLALELLAGRTLRAELDAHPDGLPLPRALAIARAIAEALDYAHGKGVVHRDLKPENIMLLPDGPVRVMDFGVARLADQPGLTTSQFFLGSPVYAAPEAVEPQRIDHRADLYGLGILLFEMLEGRPPFLHESVFKLMELHREAPLPDPANLPRPLPPEVWQLITRLCAKDPEARYPSAQALLVELGRLIEGTRQAP